MKMIHCPFCSSIMNARPDHRYSCPHCKTEVWAGSGVDKPKDYPYEDEPEVACENCRREMNPIKMVQNIYNKKLFCSEYCMEAYAIQETLK